METNKKERGIFLLWKKRKQRKRSIATLAISMARLSFVAMAKSTKSQSAGKDAVRKRRTINLVKKKTRFFFSLVYLLLQTYFFIASKVSSDKSCSILQASLKAIFSSTPRLMKILLRILCLSYIFSAISLPFGVR